MPLTICYACKNKTGKPRNALTDIKRQARNAVNCAVRDGILPSIKTLKCLLCSNKAVEYHHHINYEKENWIQVQPLCKICHIKIHK